jgi:hypothetical protein
MENILLWVFGKCWGFACVIGPYMRQWSLIPLLIQA